MCCSTKISKLLLFIFNIIFFLLGAAALGIGIFLILDEDSLLSIIGNIPGADAYNVDEVLSSASYLMTAAYILIGVGAFIFIIAFCGLCGGIRESTCLLYIYSALVGLVLCVQIAVAVICFVYSGKVEKRLQGWLTTLVDDKYTGATISGSTIVQSTDTSGISDAIDFLQVSLGCCGVINYTDFQSATQWPSAYNFTVSGVTTEVAAMVPITCCKLVDSSLWPGDVANIEFIDVQDCLAYANSNTTNVDGCYDTVLSLLDAYSVYAIGVGIGVACLELFGIIAACCIINNKKKEQIGTV